MVLKEQELLQIDEQYLRRLQKKNSDALLRLSIKLTRDLKEAMERLGQNPSNSSIPPGSQAPWDKGTASKDEGPAVDEKSDLQSDNDDEKANTDTQEDINKEESSQLTKSTNSRKPGRQVGSQGFGRTQKISITKTVHHSCGCCSICNEDLSNIEKAYTGFESVNLDFGTPDAPGLKLSNTKHIYYIGDCPCCGLENRSEPWRSPVDDLDWKKSA